MTSKKRAQDLTSWWVTVCIGKPWALEGQFLWAAKRENPPMGKLFGAVTHLESGLPEFSHLLDQCGRIEEATGGGGGEREPNKILSQEPDLCPTFKIPRKKPHKKVMKNTSQ
jgi:hypothetical protein